MSSIDKQTAGMTIFVAGVLIAAITFVLAIVVPSSASAYYADGYCAGQGGTVLTTEACDVDGEIVAVPEANIAFATSFDKATLAAMGYCDAKGGTVVTSSVCDVNGKVVPVPEIAK